MDELEFYRDGDGAACARGRDQRVATFLETDLQESVVVTRELIKLLDNGSVRGEFNGNAHSVTISPVLATIEANFDDNAADRRLPREELLHNVRGWLQFIESKS